MKILLLWYEKIEKASKIKKKNRNLKHFKNPTPKLQGNLRTIDNLRLKKLLFHSKPIQ